MLVWVSEIWEGPKKGEGRKTVGRTEMGSARKVQYKILGSV